jgi:hypothetical protein
MVDELKASIEKGQIEDRFLGKMPALTTYTLIHWALDTSSQLNGYGFPFDRTHLIFYQNLKAVYSSLTQITENLNDKTKDSKPFYKVKKLLEEVINDKNSEQIVVRDTRQGDYKSMLRQIDKYWDKLFADPIKISTHDGLLTIQPQRTNNILERLFRDIKRGYRKKRGTSSLSKVLKTIPSDTPLIKNLDSEDYMKIILNDCQTLEERFAKIDSALIVNKLKTLHCSEERFSPVMKKIIKKDNLPAVMTKLLAGKTK